MLKTGSKTAGKPSTNTTIVWLLIGFGVAIFLAILFDQPALPLLLPIGAVVASGGIFLKLLKRGQSGIPYFEIGAIYAAVVSLYALYPLIGFVVNGLTYSIYNDDRLVQANPSTTEIATVGWYYVIHLVAFMIAYVLTRRSESKQVTDWEPPKMRTLSAAVIVFAGINVFFLILDEQFSLSSGTYFESYLAFNQLPVVIAQVATLLDGVRFTVELVILAAMFFDYKKYRLLIFGWLGLIVVLTFTRLGNRTEMVLLLLSAAILYHTLVRHFSMKAIALASVGGLMTFLVLGFLREGWLFSGGGAGYNPFAYSGEFETIFGNAFDLSHRAAVGGLSTPDLNFYFSDLLIVVPHQFVPFDKVLPADWYVSTYYPMYAAKGGGLAFGTIAESMIGAGVPDLILRGGALGFILAWIHRYASRKSSFWMLIFYVWLDTQVYQSFRNTTFIAFYLFLYKFIWIVMIVKGLSSLLSGAQSRFRTIPAPASVLTRNPESLTK
jgi:hypothetical protein